MEHKIRVLSSEMTNKISAGEVVGRPLSVVKELVENSIDAGATHIKVELKNSGFDEICVTDNGIGMNKDNVELCLVKHATSKVVTEEDIYKIITLGFRGEALASIAAVSQFDMLTSIDGMAGYHLKKYGDEKQQLEETSTNKGTKISVKHLFFNTPARFKHQSSAYAEIALITKYLNMSALTNPSIKIELLNNDNLNFSTLGDSNIQNIIMKIHGTNVAKNLLEFSNENDHFKVNFHICKPQVTNNTKKGMYIAVNNRVIRNKKIDDAVIKAYGQFLHTGQYPITFLDICTDYSLIDINIHPSKEQIQISLMDKLEELIIETIKVKLEEISYISQPKIDDYDVKDFFKYEHKPLVEETPKKEPKIKITHKELLEDKIEADITKGSKFSLEGLDLNLEEYSTPYIASTTTEEIIKNDDSYKEYFLDGFEQSDEDAVVVKSVQESAEKEEVINYTQNTLIQTQEEKQNLIEGAVFIGIYRNTYLMYEGKDGLHLVDQHAAQERIRYERIMELFKSKKFNFQRTLVPLTYSFSSEEFENINKNIDKFNEFGFKLEKFGPNTLRIVETDAFLLKLKFLEKNFKEIVGKIINEKGLSFEKVLEDIAISMACKGSIKAHDYITKYEAEELLGQLSMCNQPYTCPHGRPVIVNLEDYQIEKMFKRVS